MTIKAVVRWLDATIVDLGRQFRLSYLPPLMIYLAAGVSGLTAIVGTFFIKEYLGLSAAFLAGLTFWAGIPWALKMPLGHLVDVIWRWKAVLVYLGAAMLASSIAIMYALIVHTDAMAAILRVEAWFVLSALLAPSGYVVQDVVADALTVEAVPQFDDRGQRFSESDVKMMHTTVQTLGRFAVVSGLIAVAVLNIVMFKDVETLSQPEKTAVYADIYLLSLTIPLISVCGVVLGTVVQRGRARKLRERGYDGSQIERMLLQDTESARPDWYILGGGLAFVAFTLLVGLNDWPGAQEIIFTGSMGIVLVLMYRLLLALDADARKTLIGTAIVIFAFRAVPLPGAAATWFEIDVLGFDQQFLSVLSLISACLALAGMLILRPLMARRSIVWLVTLLTLIYGVLSLPNIGLYYGLHEWTAAWSDGVIDARFIAMIDTAIESPLGQIAMIPMLAWIAKNAPAHLKATFFAVMASFTNLALSASSLATRYLNELFVVSRQVVDRASGAVQVPADYSELGWLLIVVAAIVVALPLATIAIVQLSPLRTAE